jgi:hypothetical protein
MQLILLSVHLQCLLCSGKLPPECLSEVRQFVHTHPQLHGNLSLQVLCVPTREATNILLDFCPHALLQYAKVMGVSLSEISLHFLHSVSYLFINLFMMYLIILYVYINDRMIGEW